MFLKMKFEKIIFETLASGRARDTTFVSPMKDNNENNPGRAQESYQESTIKSWSQKWRITAQKG